MVLPEISAVRLTLWAISFEGDEVAHNLIPNSATGVIPAHRAQPRFAQAEQAVAEVV